MAEPCPICLSYEDDQGNLDFIPCVVGNPNCKKLTHRECVRDWTIHSGTGFGGNQKCVNCQKTRTQQSLDNKYYHDILAHPQVFRFRVYERNYSIIADDIEDIAEDGLVFSMRPNEVSGEEGKDLVFGTWRPVERADILERIQKIDNLKLAVEAFRFDIAHDTRKSEYVYNDLMNRLRNRYIKLLRDIDNLKRKLATMDHDIQFEAIMNHTIQHSNYLRDLDHHLFDLDDLRVERGYVNKEATTAPPLKKRRQEPPRQSRRKKRYRERSRRKR